MATAVPPFWKKKPEVEGVRATLERLFDQGEKDELLKVVVGMLGEALSRNDELTWRLQAALKLLGRKKSERISKEQLALFLAKLTEEQAKLAETPETEVPAETPAAEPPAKTVNTPAGTPAATPKTPHKKPFPEHLRREVVFIPVSDDKRVCDECGEQKSPMGYDTQSIWEFNQWDTLSVYLDDPRVPISNAHVERNQRKTALTRKNALFAGSDEGGKRLATLLTILTNCWLHKVPTFDYLRDVLAKLVDTRFKGRLDDLLPHAWLAARAAPSK